jgi:hypothetical protein
MKKMARSPSNRGITRRNSNLPPAARNTQDTTQAVRRMPGVSYGDQKDLTEQQQAAPLPKDTLPQAQPRQRRQMSDIDVFGPTQKINEPVTSGLNIGPGPGPAVPPENNVNDLLYQMYALTGDTALLQLVDFD